MKTKVLVMGAGGMLGHTLMATLTQESKAFDVWGTLRNKSASTILNQEKLIFDLDALCDQSLLTAVNSIRPDVIVNCIGLIKQSPQADDSALTIALNALLPHRLKKLCDAAAIRLIHISTDCVFSGDRGLYSESDKPDATDLYGRSKLLGELNGDALTIRTSIIGPELKGHYGLFDWYVKNQGQTVKGFTQAYFSGLTTVELSRTIARIIESFPDLKGLYHVSGERIDKYSLLHMIKSEYKIQTEIKADNSLVIDRSLDDSHFRQTTGLQSKNWSDMLQEMHDQIMPIHCPQ